MSKVASVLGSHKKLVIAVSVILVLGIVVGIVFLAQPKPAANANSGSSTVQLSRMDIEQTVTAIGTAQSIDSRSITSSQTGKIVSVAVTEGQNVQQGDTLCIFDTSLIDINISSAQSSLASAQAQQGESIAQAEGMVSSAYDQYNYDKTRLDAEAQKAQDALKAAKSAVPEPGAADPIPALQTAYDTAVATRDTTLRADSSAITSAENALVNQRLMDTTSTIQTQLDTYLLQKEEATITSPINGTVTSIAAKVNGYASMEAPLFVVEDLTELEVLASVPEYDDARLTDDLTVHIISDALQGVEWKGTIKRISPVATDANGNFSVTILVSSPLQGLKSGMSTKLNIVCDSKKNVFAVPYGAVMENPDGTSVISVIDGEATSGSETKWREIAVTTGLETDYYVEISGSGLVAGLTVDIDPDSLNTTAPSDSIMGMF